MDQRQQPDDLTEEILDELQEEDPDLVPEELSDEHHPDELAEEEIVKPKILVIDQPKNLIKEKIGVVYLAFGKKYIHEAIASARSFKKFHPKVGITIWSDEAKMLQERFGGNLFQNVVQVDLDEYRRGNYRVAPYAKLNKIMAMRSFPYQVTLYLDCDTKVKKPIGELFKWGTQHDICIANSPKLDKTVRPFRLVNYRRKGAYNSGVVVFREGEAVAKLFDRWLALCYQDKNIYQKGVNGSKAKKFYDQPKLVKLLNQKNRGVSVRVIPNTLYNVRHTMIPTMRKEGILKKTKIIHKHP